MLCAHNLQENVLQNGTTSAISNHLLRNLRYFADFSYKQLPLSLPSHCFPGYLASPLHQSSSMHLIVFCMFSGMLPSF